MDRLTSSGVAITLFASTNVDDIVVLIGIGAMVLVEAGTVTWITGWAERG